MGVMVRLSMPNSTERSNANTSRGHCHRGISVSTASNKAEKTAGKRGKDDGAWSVPKGEIEPGEDELEVARREFEEETGTAAPAAPAVALGQVRLASGKVVVAWAIEGDLDPDTAVSNTFELEWPPRSGRTQTFPEIDQVRWFDLDTARETLNPAQRAFVDRLVEAVG